MKVLVACEYSGVVRDAFTAMGHDATSCDLLPTESEGKHYEGDVLDILNDGWDLMICHPPCTYFSRAGIQFIHKQADRKEKLIESFEFVKKLWNAPIKRIALENPAGWLCTNWRRPNQIIHPWYFGDNEMKETCLWLKGLPRLQGLIEVAANKSAYKPKPAASRVGSDGKMKNKYFMSRMTNGKDRAKTFPGIAKAMAEQWGNQTSGTQTTTKGK
jgi:hypothetical protein